MWPFRRRKFRKDGGRTGVIRYACGDRRGELEWEMLVADFDLVINGDRCRWTAPEEASMTRQEVRALAQELATEMNVRVDLAFSDGSEDVSPQRRL